MTPNGALPAVAALEAVQEDARHGRSKAAEALTEARAALAALTAESDIDAVKAALQLLTAGLEGSSSGNRAVERERAVAAIKKVKAVSGHAMLVDAFLGARDGASRDGGAGLGMDDPEPAADAQDTGELLSELVAVLVRHVVFPTRAAALAVALWILHTWAFEAADYTPRLSIRSPAPRCGKSLLLEILAVLCRRALATSNTSSAMIYRVVEAEQPTLLLDEVETYFAEREELRGITNAGYSRAMGFVTRVNPETLVVEKFRCFAPVALAGIGRLPGTVEDRSIPIVLARKAKGAKVEKFRRRVREALASLRPRLERWQEDIVPLLRGSEPAVPDALNDRAADIWEPLLAIADLAGGDWPAFAREAAIELAGAGDAEGSTDRSMRLLSAVRSIFEPPAPEESKEAPPPHIRLPFKVIVDALLADEADGWSEAFRGKPLTTAGLANILQDFGIVSRQWRAEKTDIPTKDKRIRGYLRADLEPVWIRYLADPPSHADGGLPGRDSVTEQQPQGFQADPVGVTLPGRHADENARNANGEKGRHAVTPHEGGGRPGRGPGPLGGAAIAAAQPNQVASPAPQRKPGLFRLLAEKRASSDPKGGDDAE